MSRKRVATDAATEAIASEVPAKKVPETSGTDVTVTEAGAAAAPKPPVEPIEAVEATAAVEPFAKPTRTARPARAAKPAQDTTAAAATRPARAARHAPAVKQAAAVEAAPSVEPASEPIPGVGVETAAAQIPAAEPIPATEPITPIAAEPTPATDVESAEEPADEASAALEAAPAQPKPAATAPADANLVPLQELAPAITAVSVSRRAFLGFGLAIAGGVVGAAALGTLFPVFAEEGTEAAPIVPSWDPSNKQWAFVVDTAACIGCGLCVAACKEENNIPEEPEYTRTWIERHTTTTDGTLYVDSPDGGIDGFPPESTAPGAAGKEVESAFFMPRLCMQCANSPCTAVCPVGATYRTEDGVILVDARRCIGCGYCVVACPYGARYLVPAGEHAPNDTPGVADKCTWCYHRISKGQKPACVEVCPVGARKFGDASDPTSEIATLIAELQPLPYRPEYGTEPQVLYLGPVTKEA